MSEPTALEVDYRHQIAQLTKEREEFKTNLSQAYEDDWTASLIDRLNELCRENCSDFSEVRCGKDAAKLIQEVHGKYNSLRNERDQLAAKCAFLTDHLKCIRDFDDDSPWDDAGHCAIDALNHADQSGAGWRSPEDFKKAVADIMEKERSEQARLIWERDAEKEKKKVLVEALERIASADDEYSRITINGVGYYVRVMAKEALEKIL